jgi:hypothetical protein
MRQRRNGVTQSLAILRVEDATSWFTLPSDACVDGLPASRCAALSVPAPTMPLARLVPLFADFPSASRPAAL